MSDKFPADFLWGVATSSYQIEGAVNEGGRGPSIWDEFCERPGQIEDGTKGDIACDHYHRWPADIERMRWLGIRSYRFSISWPRIFPQGRGEPNEAGLKFYSDLVDGLLEAGIEPCVTLYHWDLPLALQEEGGWGRRGIVDDFVAYALAVVERLGDRVRWWITHNEPWCASHLGHATGHHAPGLKDPQLELRVAHHILLSHGRAIRAMRKLMPTAELGIAPNLTPATPFDQSESSRDAVREMDGFFNRWYLNPIFGRGYPEDAIEDRRRQGHLPAGPLPFVEPGDIEEMGAPIDFLGINYYSRIVVARDEAGNVEGKAAVPEEELTDMGWEVYPSGLNEILQRIDREYQPAAILITENGCAYQDELGPDGTIDDPKRVQFFKDHLASLALAIAAGVPVRGYYAWSLMDNFEWGHGFAKRFGLFHVDYETQERRPKASAHHYRNFLRALRAPDPRKVP